MSNALRPIPYEAIQPVARAARILDVLVIKFSAESTRPLIGIIANTLHQEVRFRSTPQPQNNNIVSTIVDFQYIAFEKNEKACEISGAICVIYQLNHINPSFSPSDIEAFAEVNGLYSAWPYVRELVGNTANRVGLAGVILPLWMPPKEFPAKNEYFEMKYGQEETPQ